MQLKFCTDAFQTNQMNRVKVENNEQGRQKKKCVTKAQIKESDGCQRTISAQDFKFEKKLDYLKAND